MVPNWDSALFLCLVCMCIKFLGLGPFVVCEINWPAKQCANWSADLRFTSRESSPNIFEKLPSSKKSTKPCRERNCKLKNSNVPLVLSHVSFVLYLRSDRCFVSKFLFIDLYFFLQVSEFFLVYLDTTLLCW